MTVARVVPVLVWLALVAACRPKQEPAAPTARPTVPRPVAAPPTAVPEARVLVAYGSEKKGWLEEQISAFNATAAKTGSGAVAVAEGRAMGSGEAMQDILDGRLPAVVYSPASAAYLALLNHRWLSRAGNTRPIAAGSDSLVVSPIVIALWKPMAEALGWPSKPLGWRDVLAISRDPRGWAGRGRPEWGRFKLGHTHPEFSSSGLLSVLAEASAGAGKTRGLGPADLQAAKTRNFLAGVEAAVEHYGKSTGFFAEKMRERGPAYLSAAVLYENLVVESYLPGKSAEMPLVAVYPREGTFWADHPFAFLEASWVTAEQRQAAELLLAHLKARPAQERALAFGFRPGDPAVAVTAPVDAAHGADPKQPQTLLEVPGAPVMDQLLALWREVKKPSDVTLVFDKSGSMRGRPLAEAKAGARSFIESLQPRDRVSLLFFDGVVHPPLGPLAVGSDKVALLARIDQAIASGGTALYDAVTQAYRTGIERARKDPAWIHALVVMTDGKDENSKGTLEALKVEFPREDQAIPLKVFTIAYGEGATPGPLQEIAKAGAGSFSAGKVENIVQVYRDVASFF